MARRLFGTDGIRGTAGVFPLDPPTVRRIGAALVQAMKKGSDAFSPRLLIGRDTRESGEWLERELAQGARAFGASVTSIGVAPTPSVAYLTRALKFDAGIVISASHNPYEDNGIKVFSGKGEKYTGPFEEQIESLVFDSSWRLENGEAAAVEQADHLDRYLERARTVFPNAGRLRSLRIAVDCANGAMTVAAPLLLGELGLGITLLAAEPDGRNINLRCGSTHPEPLAEAVRTHGLDLGVAFDGDGDRAIFVDSRGRVVDGDAVMLMCAKQLKAEGRLRGNAIVATVMSNIGLEVALRKAGIELIRCAVGDKYVMEEILKRNLSLGGEQSGHVIFADHLFTGDGLITTLNVLRTMAATGRELGDLADDLQTYPQVLLNVRVREKVDLEGIPAVAEVIRQVEQRLGDNGRLLVRYSGTEPLLRVMLEGQDLPQITAWGQEIVDEVERNLA
jgi:phosphoglucosamine mutase